MSIDKQKVEKWIYTNWTGSKNCPVCKSKAWQLMDDLWALVEFKDGRVVLPGQVLPLVAMLCNVCGHTIFFNAAFGPL